MSRKTVNFVLFIWIILWINFIARDLFTHRTFGEYMLLLKSGYEGKHSLAYGKRFYELLAFAEKNIPRGARYDFAGVEDLSLESRRGIYYLYPLLKKRGPDYILVYGEPGYAKPGFMIFAKLDETRFILKRQ